ncbi:MAG: hypothetical protein J6D03_03290 [Clostridia bacterium]|nr:hypothetical protein [Clostridia bacterium]
MKIYYRLEDGNRCINECPFIKNGTKVGSLICKTCKHCYGHSKKDLKANVLIPLSQGGWEMRNLLYVECSHTNKKISMSVYVRKKLYDIKNKILILLGIEL